MILNGRTIWSLKKMKKTITNSRLYELDNLSCFKIIFFAWWRVAPSFPWWKEAKIKTAPGWAKAVCCRLNGNKLASLKQISVLTASISQLFNAPPAEVGSFFAARLRHRPSTPTCLYLLPIPIFSFFLALLFSSPRIHRYSALTCSSP